jgi:hypothetical protein
MLALEVAPHCLVPILERESLGVGAVRHDHRIALVVLRAEHVRAQDESVIHCYWNIPVDPHDCSPYLLLGQKGRDLFGRPVRVLERRKVPHG